MDSSASNINSMQGAARLKGALGSNVALHDMDLDSQFQVPSPRRFGLTLLLGVLYHLKNPFYVLEHLARHSRYCLLSTRIANHTPHHELDYTSLPMAYLLGAGELNGDTTNYWIFSEGGLRRLLERTNWEICDSLATGETRDSDPVSAKDQRFFCLLRSKVDDGLTNGQLLEGWHEQEPGGWRWTSSLFRAVFAQPAGSGQIVLKLLVVEETIRRFGTVTISGTVNGELQPAATYGAAGEYTYVLNAGGSTVPVRVDYAVDHTVGLTDRDARELGVIVTSLRFLSATSL